MQSRSPLMENNIENKEMKQTDLNSPDENGNTPLILSLPSERKFSDESKLLNEFCEEIPRAIELIKDQITADPSLKQKIYAAARYLLSPLDTVRAFKKLQDNNLLNEESIDAFMAFIEERYDYNKDLFHKKILLVISNEKKKAVDAIIELSKLDFFKKNNIKIGDFFKEIDCDCDLDVLVASIKKLEDQGIDIFESNDPPSSDQNNTIFYILSRPPRCNSRGVDFFSDTIIYLYEYNNKELISQYGTNKIIQIAKSVFVRKQQDVANFIELDKSLQDKRFVSHQMIAREGTTEKIPLREYLINRLFDHTDHFFTSFANTIDSDDYRLHRALNLILSLVKILVSDDSSFQEEVITYVLNQKDVKTTEREKILTFLIQATKISLNFCQKYMKDTELLTQITKRISDPKTAIERLQRLEQAAIPAEDDKKESETNKCSAKVYEDDEEKTDSDQEDKALVEIAAEVNTKEEFFSKILLDLDRVREEEYFEKLIDAIKRLKNIGIFNDMKDTDNQAVITFLINFFAYNYKREDEYRIAENFIRLKMLYDQHLITDDAYRLTFISENFDETHFFLNTIRNPNLEAACQHKLSNDLKFKIVTFLDKDGSYYEANKYATQESSKLCKALGYLNNSQVNARIRSHSYKNKDIILLQIDSHGLCAPLISKFDSETENYVEKYAKKSSDKETPHYLYYIDMTLPKNRLLVMNIVKVSNLLKKFIERIQASNPSQKNKEEIIIAAREVGNTQCQLNLARLYPDGREKQAKIIRAEKDFLEATRNLQSVVFDLNASCKATLHKYMVMFLNAIWAALTKCSLSGASDARDKFFKRQDVPEKLKETNNFITQVTNVHHSFSQI